MPQQTAQAGASVVLPNREVFQEQSRELFQAEDRGEAVDAGGVGEYVHVAVFAGWRTDQLGERDLLLGREGLAVDAVDGINGGAPQCGKRRNVHTEVSCGGSCAVQSSRRGDWGEAGAMPCRLTGCRAISLDGRTA